MAKAITSSMKCHEENESNAFIYRLNNGTHIVIHSNVTNGSEEDASRLQLSVGKGGLDRHSVMSRHAVEAGPQRETDTEGMEDEAGNHPNDLMVKVTSYECRQCSFTSREKEKVVRHCYRAHSKRNGVENPPENNNIDDGDKSSERCVEKRQLSEEHRASKGCAKNRKSGDEKKSVEKLIYLCAQCEKTFDDLGDCKLHMMEDHKLVSVVKTEGPSTAREILEAQSNPSAPLSLEAVAGGEETDEEEEEEGASIKRCVSRFPRGLQEDYWVLKKRGGSQAAEPREERKLRCPHKFCSYRFCTEGTLKYHVTCHDEEKEFSCAACKEKFSKWRQCAMHLWKAHAIDVDLLACPTCRTYKTVTLMKLETHRRIHEEARDFVCDVCNKGFKQVSQLRNHKVSHLDRSKSGVSKWYTAKECDMCHKTFADSKCLKKHMQAVHSKLRPYVCNICGHMSARKAMLQMHQRQHTGEKPFRCNACDYRTGDHNSLRRHKMRHTGERPYKCPYCKYAAIQSNSYKNHLKKKHPDHHGDGLAEACQQQGEDAAASQPSVEQPMFPSNAAAAKIIYSCIEALSREHMHIQPVSGTTTTSADGSTQTITIHIPEVEGASTDYDLLPTPDESSADPAVDAQESVVAADSGGIAVPAAVPEGREVAAADGRDSPLLNIS